MVAFVGRKVVGSGDVSYEDFFAVRIEYAKPITEAQATKLAALYEGWKSRVEKESRKIAKADGDELLPIRFDGLGIRGVHANGGASRFLSADAACAWLTKELAKDPAVAKVTFGDEDVPATPKAGAAVAASPLRAELDAILGEERGAATVLGCISIRFTGAELAAPGRALGKAIADAVELAGEVGSIWVRGTWGRIGALEEVNQGRDLSEKTGKALLDRILDDVPKMPVKKDDPRIVHLVLSDGPRPERTKGCWVDGSRVAASFGIQITLEPMEGRGLGGQIEIYVPLRALEEEASREAWIALGERTFTALHGSIGTFSPALWMESIRPDDLPLSLFTKLPAVSIPRLVGRHAGGFTFPDFEPDLHHGLFEPPWICWLSPALAKSVKGYPGIERSFDGARALRVEDEAPLVMDDARYDRYRKAWAALAPLRIRWTSGEDGNDAWRCAPARFDAKSLRELGPYLEKCHDDAKRRNKLHWSCRSALGAHDGKKAFEEATEALALGAGPETYEVLLEAILCFGGEGKPKLALAKDALAEALPFSTRAPRLSRLAARLYLEMGDPESALAALAAATPLGDGRPDPLDADPAFAPLHDDERFRSAFGWAPRSAMKNAKPDLSAFPSFAKAASKAEVAFAPGATPEALAAAEKALGVKLPAVYRQMLAAFDGAIFKDGREILYGTTELIAKNPNPERAVYTLAIGRNLVLAVSRAKGGEAEIAEVFQGARTGGTTLRWKKLDACLTQLVRRT